MQKKFPGEDVCQSSSLGRRRLLLPWVWVRQALATPVTVLVMPGNLVAKPRRAFFFTRALAVGRHGGNLFISKGNVFDTLTLGKGIQNSITVWPQRPKTYSTPRCSRYPPLIGLHAFHILPPFPSRILYFFHLGIVKLAKSSSSLGLSSGMGTDTQVVFM